MFSALFVCRFSGKVEDELGDMSQSRVLARDGSQSIFASDFYLALFVTSGRGLVIIQRFLNLLPPCKMPIPALIRFQPPCSTRR